MCISLSSKLLFQLCPGCFKKFCIFIPHLLLTFMCMTFIWKYHKLVWPQNHLTVFLLAKMQDSIILSVSLVCTCPPIIYQRLDLYPDAYQTYKCNIQCISVLSMSTMCPSHRSHGYPLSCCLPVA